MRRRNMLLPARTVHAPEPAGALAGWFLLLVAWTFLVLLVGSASGRLALSPTTWYIARSSGLVLFGLSWLQTMSGLATTTKLFDRVWARHLQYSIHTYTFHLWYGFLLLHLGGLLLDPTVSIGVRNLIVPWTSGIREPWTGFGVLAAEMAIVVGGSAWLRRFVGFTVWRALHWLSFPVFLMGLLHGLGGGTDASSPPVMVMYVLAGGTVLFMACYRVLRGKPRDVARLSMQSPIAGDGRPIGNPRWREDRLGPLRSDRINAASDR